ncbi:MAG TPA: S41 family peptidase [Terriglobales bacterium]|nr:S41 family peptidase [Terriglobales bacterium]
MKKFATSICLVLLLSGNIAAAQDKPAQLSGFDRDRARSMLQMIADDVRKHYYDPKFHGLDWNARVAEARNKIDSSPSFNMALSHIAGALDALNDSHTFFLPPSRPYRHDFGYQTAMIGDRCFVLRVRPGSDAEGKGLKPGDEVLTINGFAPSRDNLWKMQYVFESLRPQASLHLQLRSPSGADRPLEVLAKMQPMLQVKDLSNGNDISEIIRDYEDEDRRMRTRWQELGDLYVLKISRFLFSDSEADDMIGRARKHKAMIVDLRGNGGGAVDSLQSLLGRLFENEVKIADRVRRNDTKPFVAKSHRNPYNGKVVVLVDSRSASASELFARVVQVEKRGVVMGDTSSGSVMESMHYRYQTGTQTIAFFGASITDADLIMKDGVSLEHHGVVPDETVLPTAADLAANRDPVLAHAAETLGYKMTADEAGKLFPYQWSKQ